MSVRAIPAATKAWPARQVLRDRLNTFTVLSVITGLVVALLVLYPIGWTWVTTVFAHSRFQGHLFGDVLGSPTFWTAVRNSAILVSISGTLSIVFGSALAWLNERTDAGIPVISRLLPVIPLLMPGVALSIGWVFLGDSRVGYLNVWIRNAASVFGIHMNEGPLDINSWTGLIIVYTIFLIPFPYLLFSAALQNLDRSLEEASRMSGAGLGRTLRRVSLPSVRPALIASAFLIAVEGFGLYSVPVIIGTRARINVLSIYTIDLVNSYPARIDDAVIVSFFLVACFGSLWYASRHIQRSGLHAKIGGATNTSQIELGLWRYVARLVLVLFILATSVLPFLAIVFVSVQHFWTTEFKTANLTTSNFSFLFDQVGLKNALKNSVVLGLESATICVIIAAVLAGFISYSRSRAERVFGELIDGAQKLPAAVTHIVIGIAFLVVFGAAPFRLYGTTIILLLAYVMASMPTASTATMSAASQVGGTLTEASWMSGASTARTFGRVSLPLMGTGLAAGWALVFVSSISNLTIAALLSSGPSPVVGFEILRMWEQGTYPQLAALAVLMTVSSLVVVGLALAIGRGRARRRQQA